MDRTGFVRPIPGAIGDLRRQAGPRGTKPLGPDLAAGRRPPLYCPTGQVFMQLKQKY